MDAPPSQTRELAPKLAAGQQYSTGANRGEGEGNIDSSRQPLTQQSFRRRRKGRACSACHLRRIRCDAASLGVPCTNCTAFSVHCFIPPRRKKRRSGATTEEGGSSSVQGKDGQNPEIANPNPKPKSRKLSNAKRKYDDQRIDPNSTQPEATQEYANLVQPEIATAPIKQLGGAAYLAEHSHMSLLVEAQSGVASSDNTCFEFPDSFKTAKANNGSGQLDEFEINILNMQGALSLPPESLCDELVEAYFTWVAPLVPVINRSRFMQQYKASRHPPSLLLLNAICLAGSRVCNTVQILDDNGSPISAATIFYRRAKALYESGYETDRITIVQALVLMGWYWEEPGKVTRNVFYWLGLAVTVAEGLGLHRNTNKSHLSIADKRLWKRIWWTLFTRDRSVAVALGRPLYINMSHSDVEMLCEDDFIEDDDGLVALSPPESLHVEFFLQYIKICQIMDLILAQHYSISPRAPRHHALAITECDLALAAWLKNCPGIVKWDPSAYQFWPALLHCFYHTTSCLLHRAHLPPRAPTQDEQRRDQGIFPRRNPAFQSACEVTAVIECMIIHNEICCSPPFIVYALMTALLVLVYEMHTAVGDNYIALQKRTWVCMHALRKLSNVWLVAKMAHKLFESIIITAGFEDCLQESNNDNEFGSGCNVKLEDSGNQSDESILKQSPRSQRSPKSSEPALTSALIDSMNATLKSLTLLVGPKTMHGVGFNTTTMGPSPLAAHDTNERETSHTGSGTLESSPYSDFMATLRPHEVFSKDMASNIRKLQGQSSTSALQELTLPEQMSPWNLSVEIPTLQAEQYSGQYHPRRASATTAVFGWQIEQ